MKQELLAKLTEEVKQKLAACKTQEEIQKILAAAGIESLDDDLLENIAGGLNGRFTCPPVRF